MIDLAIGLGFIILVFSVSMYFGIRYVHKVYEKKKHISRYTKWQKEIVAQLKLEEQLHIEEAHRKNKQFLYAVTSNGTLEIYEGQTDMYKYNDKVSDSEMMFKELEREVEYETQRIEKLFPKLSQTPRAKINRLYSSHDIEFVNQCEKLKTILGNGVSKNHRSKLSLPTPKGKPTYSQDKGQYTK